MQLAKLFVQPAAGHLGPPEVERCKQCEDIPAEEGVMEMPDDVIRIVQHQIG